MFNRGSSSATGPLSVEITLLDGRELHGKLIVGPGRTLTDTLNNGAPFIEFEPIAGERMYIARSALQSVKPIDLPAVPRLSTGPGEESFDPASILGVRADATRKDVHDAYLRLAKIYHPDRYATADLPREVQDYLAAMVRRINAARDALEAAHQRRMDRQDAVFRKAGGA